VNLTEENTGMVGRGTFYCGALRQTVLKQPMFVIRQASLVKRGRYKKGSVVFLGGEGGGLKKCPIRNACRAALHAIRVGQPCTQSLSIQRCHCLGIFPRSWEFHYLGINCLSLCHVSAITAFTYYELTLDLSSSRIQLIELISMNLSRF